MSGTSPAGRGVQDCRFRIRIVEVLRKYNIELSEAPLDALALAMHRMNMAGPAIPSPSKAEIARFELTLLEAYERGRSDERARCLERIKHWFGGNDIFDQGYECVREIEAAGIPPAGPGDA